jgi:hypothetical protein
MRFRALLPTTAVLLIALPARAQDPQHPEDAVVLEYLPSPAVIKLCYPAEYFYDEIQVRLGFQLFQVTAPNHLTVKVDRVKDRFRSELELRDETGKVTLSNTFLERNCTAALRDVLVVIAVHFTRLPEPLPCVAEPLPPAPIVPPPPAPVLLVSPVSPPDKPRYEGGLASIFTIGKAPVILGGVGLFLGLRWRDYSAAVEARALFAPSAGIEDTAMTYFFVGASATACRHTEWALACLRVEAGSLYGSSAKSYTDPKHAPSSGLGVRLAKDWALTSSLAVRPYLEVLGATASSRVTVTARTEAIWSSPTLSASIGLGFVMTQASPPQDKK